MRSDLLFLGTEFGPFFSVDAGQHWTKLPGAPTIPFRDLEIQRSENDLVGATFGRGFYVLDDYTPLREINAETFTAGEFHLYAPRAAKLYIEDRVLGGPKGSQGDAYFTAENPPFGAVFTYYLPEDLQSAKDKRHKMEAEKQKDNLDNPPPDWDALRAEQFEEAPAIILTIRDEQGGVVSRVNGPTKKGLQRVAWDLRYSGFDRGAPLVTPGTYTVDVTQRIADQISQLSPPQPFEVAAAMEPTLERQDAKQVLEFQLAVADLQRKIVGSARKLNESLEQVEAMKKVIQDSRSLEPAVYEQARAIELQLKALDVRLSGDTLRDSKSQAIKRSIIERVQTALGGTLNQTYGPTQTHRKQYEIAQSQFADASGGRLTPMAGSGRRSLPIAAGHY